MDFLWKPSDQRVNKSLLHEFRKFTGEGVSKDFRSFWQWSVSNSEIFWSKFWDYSKIIGDKGSEIIKKDKIFNKSKFFPDSKLNYAENILKKKTNNKYNTKSK